MAVLSELEPKKVFSFFEQLCAIPHGSHHTKQISDFLVGFAAAHGLRYRQDESNNVVIWQDASAGYENAPTVMLQGHMDMVTEKTEDCTKDMEREGIDLFVEGDTIGARGTTLGGDDGIAVAMALAVLDSPEIPHGPLECLFTVDEEVGMLGARALDASDLKAKYLLNIDSEEEGVLTVSCAGGTRLLASIPVRREAYQGITAVVRISGLIGGHSGEEINMGRASANILMGRVLYEMQKETELRLVSIKGGTKDNAIPREAEALVCADDLGVLRQLAQSLTAVLRGEYRVTDGEITVSAEDAESGLLPMDRLTTDRVIALLHCSPNGVQEMSADVPGLVQTSLNMGRLWTDEKGVTASYMVRSGISSQQLAVASRLEALTHMLGGTTEIPASYGAWQYRADSPLRERMKAVFCEQYGRPPRIAALHAGLECGILSAKMPQLDCISIGPDIKEIHTPRERLYIASTQRTWALVLETLKQLTE